MNSRAHISSTPKKSRSVSRQSIAGIWSGRSPRHMVTLPTLVVVVLLGAGCGLFETRTPEDPATGGSAFIPPTSPDIVITNLQTAVRDKNTDNYLRCLPDTLNSTSGYTFIPTAAAAGRYPTSFLGWGLQSERSYFAALKAFTDPADASSLSLDGGFSVLGADSAVYEAGYVLSFKHGISDIPETVEGNLQFVLRIDRNSTWSIARWIDNPLDDRQSWSEWKGRFSN